MIEEVPGMLAIKNPRIGLRSILANNGLLVSTLAFAGLSACATANDSTSTGGPTFEEFEANTHLEPWTGGLYIVNGDTPVVDRKALYEFWQNMQQGSLIVDNQGGTDSKWNDTQKHNLTYCVSNAFGLVNKPKIVEALRQATDLGWETKGDVNFIYVPAEDGNCTSANNNVLFNVGQVSGQPYLARAFFPGGNRSSQEVLVDISSFEPGPWPLKNILAHELGHSLGFRHEHTRPEAGTCFEDNNFRPLTPYDSASVMHYPQCNGSSNDLSFTAQDAVGIAALYGAPGAPGGGGGGDGGGDGGGTETTETDRGTVARGAKVDYQPLSVKAGSLLTVVMSGTGDPDLYVRFGSAPTSTRFACRPFIDGPKETCAINVPAGQSQAFLQVRGFRAGTFTLNVTYTKP
jgi:serine protease